MTDVDGYIRTRESGRLTQFVLFMPLTLALAASVAIRIGGSTEIAIIVFIGILELVYIAIWLRKPSPRFATNLVQPYSVGTWPASAPVFDFPDVVERYPRLRTTSALLGTFTLEPSGARWRPSAQTARSFGATEVVWGPEWTIRAKGVRGFARQVQLTLTKPGVQSIVIWTRHASDLRAP